MSKTLKDMLSERSAESQARIQEMADDLLLETQFHKLREELGVS